MNNTEYWTEIKSLAELIAEETMDECENDREAAEEVVNDSRLHETIDGHQWVIYNNYNLEVIKHSENKSYYADNFGGEALSASLEQGGLDTLHCHIAFWCMYADVQHYISDALDDLEEAKED